MRRILSHGIAIALITAGATLAWPSGPAGAAPGSQSTPFAMAGSGFGTLVQGGALPVGSDRTGYAVIGCTNKTGRTNENHEASVTVPGLGVVKGVRTKVWTVRNGGVVSSYSQHTIAGLTLVDTPIGSLKINAISSLSRAFHDKRGFHSSTTTKVGSITFTPAGGEPIKYPLPTPDQPITIPGLVTIALGSSHRTHGAGGATADASALDIKVLLLGTRARVAHSSAKISSGIASGVYSGYAAATRAKALGDQVKSGPTPLQVMPCQGTRGKVREQSIAHLDLGGGVVVKGLTARGQSTQTAARASGTETGRVAGVNIGNGALVVNAIVARAHVVRTDHGLTRSAAGTTVGQISVDGQVRKLPKSGVLEIPGVAKLESSLVTKIPGGLFVTGLRITLLDGSLAQINLGQAKLAIAASGL